MSPIENDPILGRFFDTPEKKARWVYRLKLLYIVWIVFLIVGIFSVLLLYIF